MQNQYTYYKEYTSPKDASKQFIIRSMVLADVEEAVKLMVETHEVCHPIMVCIPYNKEIYTEMLTRLVSTTVVDDLSTAIFDKETNKMVGVIYAQDLFSKRVDNSDLVLKWPEFRPYVECIAAFKGKHEKLLTVKGPNEGVNVFYMTVRMDYQTHGLGTKLVFAITDHPKLTPYPHITGIAVSSFTVKIVDKLKSLGYDTFLDTVEYDTFKDSTGTCPFANIKEELKKRNLSEDHRLTLIVLDKPKRE